jgi:hypothetical protein
MPPNDATQLDFNRLVDVIVPIYSICVVLLILSFRKYSNKNTEPMVYKRKKADTANADIDWKDRFNGTFQVYKVSDSNPWFTFLGKSYLERVAGGAMLLRLRHILTVSDGLLSFERDFGDGYKYWGIKGIKLAADEASAQPSIAVNENGIRYEYRAWFDEDEQALNFSSVPAEDKSLDSYLHVRKWEGNNIYMVRCVEYILITNCTNLFFMSNI